MRYSRAFYFCGFDLQVRSLLMLCYLFRGGGGGVGGDGGGDVLVPEGHGAWGCTDIVASTPRKRCRGLTM